MAQGRVVIDINRCKGCELCIDACPQDVLVLSEDLNANGYRPVFMLEHDNHCTGCSLCAVACPDGCITVFKEVPQRQPRQMSPA